MKSLKHRINEGFNQINEKNITKSDIRVGTVIKTKNQTFTVTEIKDKYFVGTLRNMKGDIVSKTASLDYEKLDNPHYKDGYTIVESTNESVGKWYLANDDEDKVFEYDVFDKDRIRKDLYAYLKKNQGDELWLYKVNDNNKYFGDHYLGTYVWYKGGTAKEIHKNNKTYYSRLDENLNEAVENMGIEVLTKDVEKAKNALNKYFTIVDVRKITNTQSAIEFSEKPSRENYTNLKKAMGGIKWDHALPF